MTVKDENGKYITNHWLLGVLVTVILAIGGFLFTDVWAQLRLKVDKEQYTVDIQRVETKLDTLINMHMEKKQ